MSAELFSEFDERVLTGLALENEQDPASRMGAIMWRDFCGVLRGMGWQVVVATMWGKQFTSLRAIPARSEVPR